MADKKISELNILNQVDVDTTADYLAIVDSSASETKKVTPASVVLEAIKDNAVDINSGAIDGTTIGGTTAAAITGTTITATAFSGPINGTVGATTPAAGAFTTVDGSIITASTRFMGVYGGAF